MTPDDIEGFEARLDELRPEVQEYYELEAMLFQAEVDYLIAEGFIEAEEIDGEIHLYAKADATYMEVPDDCCS